MINFSKKNTSHLKNVVNKEIKGVLTKNKGLTKVTNDRAQ